MRTFLPMPGTLGLDRAAQPLNVKTATAAKTDGRIAGDRLSARASDFDLGAGLNRKSPSRCFRGRALELSAEIRSKGAPRETGERNNRRNGASIPVDEKLIAE